MDSIRIDKWLWAVRLFKTRSQAADACKAGKVRIDGLLIKASREVRVGDKIEVSVGPLKKFVEVKTTLKNRVSAKLVEEHMIDHTPEEEYERVKMLNKVNSEFRDRGAGRPTKKDRRDIDVLKNNF
jgi:ribosome-associated heat shock protein Hsp15